MKPLSIIQIRGEVHFNLTFWLSSLIRSSSYQRWWVQRNENRINPNSNGSRFELGAKRSDGFSARMQALQ